MRSIRLPGEAHGGDHWLTMDEARLYALTEDARRALCRDWSDRRLRLHHVMKLVLFHQFDGLRAALRDGRLTPEEAACGMRSPFGLGYLSGLGGDFAAACGLPVEGGIAAAARLDLHLFTFGLSESQALLAAGRTAPPTGDAFGRGAVTAEWDVETYKCWLEGAEEEPSQGLSEGLLRQSRDAGAMLRPAWLGSA